jgi:copper chaperone
MMHTFQVEEMSCGHCVAAVTRAVHAVDAAAAVRVDLASKRVEIDSAADAVRLRAAIADAGYPVAGPPP